MKHLIKWLVSVLISLMVVACAGGGSAGTGTGSGLTIQGRVLDTDSVPVADALVVIKETGDSDISDQNGDFSIATSAVTGDLTLEITSQGKTNFTTITVTEGDSTLQITVKINPLIDEIDSSQLEVNAKIVGECGRFFDNARVITQIRGVKEELSCTAKVRVESAKVPLAHVPIGVQFRACKAKSPWATIALGATMTGVNLGTGQVNFDFQNDEKHCVYRILAPFETESVDPVIYEIHTQTYQSFLEKQN